MRISVKLTQPVSISSLEEDAKSSVIASNSVMALIMIVMVRSMKRQSAPTA